MRPVDILGSVEPDEGGEDEQPEFRSPPPRDDRVWVHPSEVAGAGGLARSSRGWVIVLLSGTAGAVLSVGVVAAAGGLHGRAHPNRVASSGVALATGRSIVKAAREARPAVVELHVRRGGAVQRGGGVVFRSDGFILTSADVLRDADGVTAVFVDGRHLPARIVGTDAESNVGVVRVSASNLTPPRLGKVGEVREGQAAVAIEGAHDRGSQRWATACMVTGLHHKLAVGQNRFLLDMIQTDAPAAVSSSGGALLDAAGGLIGIRASSQAEGSARAWGFATPIDFAQYVAEQLVATGKVTRAWLGVEGSDLDSATATQLKLDGGALVGNVIEGSPAQRGGLVARDVIVGVDGRPIDNMSALVVALRQRKPGDAVTLEVVRGVSREALRVSLVERPNR